MQTPTVTVVVEQTSLEEIKHPFVLMKYSDGSCRMSIDLGQRDIQAGGLTLPEAINGALVQYRKLAK